MVKIRTAKCKKHGEQNAVMIDPVLLRFECEICHDIKDFESFLDKLDKDKKFKELFKNYEKKIRNIG